MDSLILTSQTILDHFDTQAYGAHVPHSSAVAAVSEHVVQSSHKSQQDRSGMFAAEGIATRKDAKKRVRQQAFIIPYSVVT